MRILQLIDTLNPGGAERMAVNYANALSEFEHESFVVTTREEGRFKDLLGDDVKYFFLNRKYLFDIKAIIKFQKILHQHNIEIVQVHGTSWFFAVMCKLVSTNFKLIWHNHYGASSQMSFFKGKILSFFSQFFDGIISVNEELQEWAKIRLQCQSLINLPNFILISQEAKVLTSTGSNIVCLANLKPVKNHMLLLKACDLVAKKKNFNLHLIGNDFDDDYSNELKKEFEKRTYIKFHGSKIDFIPILHKMQIGVLSSNSEGMPMAILEYGARSLAVVSTDVGICKEILNGHGKISNPGDATSFANAILEYLNDPELIRIDADQLREKIENEFSANAVVPLYLQFCKSL